MRPIASGLSSLLLAFSLLCPALAAPAEASKPWSRTEANGFVTMRLTWPCLLYTSRKSPEPKRSGAF